MNELKLLINPGKFNHGKFIYGTESSKDIWEKTDFIDSEKSVDLSELREVIDSVISNNATKREADMKVALKLHKLLNISRREATDVRMWAYLGCVFAPDYVKWRWGKDWSIDGDVTLTARARYMGGSTNVASPGPKDTSTFHYLWWSAELTKDFEKDGKYSKMLMHNWNYHSITFRNSFSRVPPILKAILEATIDDWEDWKGWQKGSPMPDTDSEKKGSYRRWLYARLNIAGSTIVFDSLTYEEAKALVNMIKENLNDS